MTQDFYVAFGLGEDDRHITTIDADGVALSAIQALAEENAELRGRVDDLEAEMDRLRALISESASPAKSRAVDFLLPGSGLAAAQSGYRVSWWTVDGGGGRLESASGYALLGPVATSGTTVGMVTLWP